MTLPRPSALLCLVCAIMAGAAGHALRVPLAWVLGPMVTTAAFAIGGIRPVAPVAGRRFGQVIIGASIGLNLTTPVLASLVGWLPLMIATALVSMLAGAVLSIALARFGRIDTKTAYFAMMPGGLSEMANIGAEHGAQNEPIALCQALRVALVVCLLPPLIVSLGIAGEFGDMPQRSALPLHIVPLLLGASVAAVLVVRLLRLNNPWMIGALAGAAAITAAGYVEDRMPPAIFYFGQFLIGIATGARFRRDVVLRLARLALVSAGFILVLTAALLVYAVVLARVGGLDVASAALAASPGGFAEMAVTAQALHLNVALVTAFHFTRALLVNGFTTHCWELLNRIGFFRLGQRLLDRRF